MRNMKLLVVALASAAAGAAVVISCGGDGSRPVDAATPTCDCTGFEPAITSARIYRVDSTTPGTPTPAPFAGLSAACHAGDVVIGGGCYASQAGVALPDLSQGDVDQASSDYAVLRSGPVRFHDASYNVTGGEESWECLFDDRNGDANVVFEAMAVCFDIKPDP